MQSIIGERRRGLGFIGEGASAGGEGGAEDGERTRCAVEQGPETLDVEGGQRRGFVEGVEERVACAEGEDSYGRALVGTGVILAIVYYRWERGPYYLEDSAPTSPFSSSTTPPSPLSKMTVCRTPFDALSRNFDPASSVIVS